MPSDKFPVPRKKKEYKVDTPPFKFYTFLKNPRVTPEALEEHRRNLIADIQFAAHELGYYDPRITLMLRTVAKALREDDYEVLFSFFLSYLRKYSE